jgi:hypothetical protein
MIEMNYLINENYDGTAQLYLENLMILHARNNDAETFIQILEYLELLRPTVTWRNDQGQTFRLYAVDDEYREPFIMQLSGMELVVMIGGEYPVTIPYSHQTKSGWQWLPGWSLQERKPARIKDASLSWFSALGNFINWSFNRGFYECENETSDSSSGEKHPSRASQDQ